MKSRSKLFLISLMVTGIIITSLLTGIVPGGTGAITATGEWTWVSGSDTINQAGTYGTKGTPSANNIPGGRPRSISWIDSDGDFWLFGGYGSGSTGTESVLNDLWCYNTTSGEWTWVSGSDSIDQAGIYGTKGTPAASNVPGARYESNSWEGADGDFWLFGGGGRDSAGTMEGRLNDLWRYNTTSGEWTWVSGSDTVNQAGTYGTKGTPTAANIPGARRESISWVDSGGDFWLFGGYGFFGRLNDLWRYNTSSGEWTWISGSDIANQEGTYGIKGTPAASNIPGARYGSTSWADVDGDFWLFGGSGFDKTGEMGYLNDLWHYNTTTKEWTWVSGSDTHSQAGIYGTKGTSTAANIPGSRWGSISWVGADGDFWLFGGVRKDSFGEWEFLNDLWHFDTITPSVSTTTTTTTPSWNALLLLLSLFAMLSWRQRKKKS